MSDRRKGPVTVSNGGRLLLKAGALIAWVLLLAYLALLLSSEIVTLLNG